MNIYTLKDKYYQNHPNGHFFDSDTLKFFGESLSDMSVLKKTVTVTDCMGEKHTCYCVSKLGRDWNGRRRRSYAYFDVDNFDDIIPA